jgi:hypothetical protein
MYRFVGRTCCTIDVLLMIVASMALDYHYDKPTFRWIVCYVLFLCKVGSMRFVLRLDVIKQLRRVSSVVRTLLNQAAAAAMAGEGKVTRAR